MEILCREIVGVHLPNATPTQNEESTSHAITEAELEENSVVKYFLATSVGRQGENESLAERAEAAQERD